MKRPPISPHAQVLAGPRQYGRWRTLMLLVVWLGWCQLATAQLPFFLRVARQPDNLVPVSGNAGPARPAVSITKEGPAANLQPPGGAPWIVYSDRNNNTTFRSTNGTTPYRKMNFMEAFYVLKERNGYLKLVKYDPALPIGNKFSRRAITDRKAAVYYGWALKSRFLLASQSSRSVDGRRAQVVSAVLAQPTLLTNPDRYFSHDSVRLYVDPGQQTPAATKMRLYDLAYIYKLSETKRQALVGRASWFPTDSINNIILGWMPIDVLQPVGQRLFIETDTVNAFGQPIPFYRSLTALARGGQDSTVASSPSPAVSWNRLGTKFPVLDQQSVRGNQRIFLTNTLTPLVEKRQVQVLNVLGQTITSQLLTNVQSHSNRYNLIYVIEGSAAMHPYWGELLNTIQFTITQLSQDTARSIRLRAGAAIYGDYKKRDDEDKDDKTVRADVELAPLTTNYPSLMRVLSKAIPSPKARSEVEARGVRSGVYAALNRLAIPGDNNILVLVGINGDLQSILNGQLVASLLKKVECRLLAFQVYGETGDLANNFVLQARELVLEVANQSGNLKKERLVQPDMVTPTNEFNLQMGDRNVYQLAYPTRSMVPGWVLFPRKSQSLPFKELYAATDSLFLQVAHESQTIVDALEKTFQRLEPLDDRVNPKLAPIYASAGLQLPIRTTTLISLDEYPYLTRAYTPAALKNGLRWRYIALLPLDEYDGISRWLDQLSGDDIDPTRFFDRLQLRHRYRQILKAVGLPDETTTLDQLLASMLDLPIANPLFKRIPIRRLANRRYVSDALLTQLLYLMRERRDYFRRIPTFRNSRFVSNKRTYYWISEDLFK